MYQFFKKLYNTKLALKRWNKDEYGPLHHQLATCKRKLDTIQTALHLNPVDLQLRNQEKDARAHYTSLLAPEEKFARQKSRQLWLEAGDSNTKFFYNSIKSRSVKNSICRLRNTDDSFCFEPEEIKGYTDTDETYISKRKPTPRSAIPLVTVVNHGRQRFRRVYQPRSAGPLTTVVKRGRPKA
ncbi:hypothetical protein QJS10_CPA02g00605 [Acorus calamus]|uniref:Uncharacterized protein n=1 Tax=Acorus calamus TaxID=4465 RepID=A0AAV9FEE1_ACOCL|nr:hypothetical protein QJS10_CPA02g00605 [Acorus calamus]